MILFQIFYRKTEAQARAQLAQMEEIMKKGSAFSIGQALDSTVDMTTWPAWVSTILEPMGFILDENHIYTTRIPKSADAAIMRDWFYKQWQPWAASLPGEKGEFGKRLLAHAIIAPDKDMETGELESL